MVLRTVWQLQTEFDKLNRQIPALIKQNDGKTPKLYIKAIADLETVMLETIEKQKVSPKKMNAINTRGLNAVRQRIRKNNKDYAKDIDLYREDKEGFMHEEIVEVVRPPIGRPPRPPPSNGEAILGADDEGFTMVGAGGKAMQYTPESILKHLRTIVEARGRKNTDRLEQIRVMERLRDVAVNDYQKIRVLLTLISTRFDLTSGTGSQMSQEQWKLWVPDTIIWGLVANEYQGPSMNSRSSSKSSNPHRRLLWLKMQRSGKTMRSCRLLLLTKYSAFLEALSHLWRGWTTNLPGLYSTLTHTQQNMLSG